MDNITCEHLQYAHPIVSNALTKLFNLFIYHGFVPDAFGCGTVTPIPKGDKNARHDRAEDYRGIILVPLSWYR